ncbi:TrbG/VirB9 family P-type conjugative transfer protein [Massilia sp. LXY-6]|uniref:TrbG/VirB9 family P-type conjugative transfer protein n=1 Tax=Massilia sp. LXY-6 TaxID=3379823 RepID=UPI003EDFF3C3
MKAKTIVAVLFATTFALAYAGQVIAPHDPSQGRDPRIQVVAYSPDRVVPIYTGIGNPTLIEFESDEQIVDTPEGMVGMGDSKAWQVGPKANKIMLKPMATQPDTKLIVVTTKRTYAFELISVKKDMHVAPTMILRFEYPDTQARQSQAEATKHEAVTERLQQIAGNAADGDAAGARIRNRNYMKRGEKSLSPSLVEDDGRFTYMRFDSTRELPVVYKLLPDGKEALTNFHMDSDTGTMVIHETAAQFVLRYGKAVMAIRNDGFNPNGALDRAGTTLPRTVRLTKDT